MGNIFCVKFKRYPLKFHIKYLSHTQVCISLRSEILRALKFDSSWAFLKRSPEMDRNSACSRKYPSLLARGPHTGVQAPSGGRFKNTCGLLNPRALKILMLFKNRIFQCMGKIFCVEFQRFPLKFHTKYHTHILKDAIFKQHWNFKSSDI